MGCSTAAVKHQEVRHGWAARGAIADRGGSHRRGCKSKAGLRTKRLIRKNQYLQSEIARLSELANKSPAEPDEAHEEVDFNDDAPVQQGPKRKSGYARMKTRAKLAEADVAALERLVAKILDHLRLATDPNITDQQRERLRMIEVATRAALDEE